MRAVPRRVGSLGLSAVVAGLLVTAVVMPSALALAPGARPAAVAPAGAATGPTTSSAGFPTSYPTTVPGPPRPPADPQVVVVQVPSSTLTVTSGSVVPCPALTRADFDFAFRDDASPPVVETIDDWSAPQRLTTERPPTTAVISLKPRVQLPAGRDCGYAFSFASYASEGPTWETSGRLTVIQIVSGVIDASTRSLTLVVKPPPCAGQIDLWAGTTRFDGSEGPLPAYPNGVPAEVSVATWNGDRNCTGPGVVAPLAVFAVPACPAAGLTWLIVNPNTRGVDVSVVAENSRPELATRLLAEPGTTPVVLASEVDAVTLVVTWSDDGGTVRTVRTPAATRLAPADPLYAVTCADEDKGLSIRKTADPEAGSKVRPGATITWRVRIKNETATPLTDLEVVDVVPSLATVTDPRSGSLSPDGRVLSWRVTVPAKGSVTLTYVGRVSPEATQDQLVVNTALVPGAGISDETVHRVRIKSGTDSTTGPPKAGGGGPLARTGAEIGTALLLAAGAVALGLVLVSGARRRRLGDAGSHQA